MGNFFYLFTQVIEGYAIIETQFWLFGKYK